MLAIRIDLLTGRYAASKFDDRDAPEWPPEPGRLFSALVATWADADEPDPAEREALLWLEQQEAPEVSCSGASERSRVTHYVPDNDVTVARRDLSPQYQKLVSAAEAASRAPSDPRAAKAADKARSDMRARTEAAFSPGSDSPAQAAAALRVLPDLRGRQGRSYPVAIPDDSVVTFAWPAADPPNGTADSLDALLSRVGRLGHSSSFVSCMLVSEVPQATLLPWRPDQAGDEIDTVLRVPSHGLFAELEREFARHQGREPRVLPSDRRPYLLRRDKPVDPATPANAGSWQVLTLDGPALPISNGVALSRTIRDALMKHSPHQPAPGIITGHSDGVAPTVKREGGHLAIVPLPFVGRKHADGSVKGVALILPRHAGPSEESALAEALDAWVTDGGHAHLQHGLSWRLAPVEAGEVRPHALRRSRWAGDDSGSREWLTVTPIALDRMPKRWSKRQRHGYESVYDEAAEIIATSCTTVGLPRPNQVIVRTDGTMHGVPPVSRFRPYRATPSGPPRVSVHAFIRFDEPVQGPVLIGRGRHHGAGLLAPLDGAA